MPTNNLSQLVKRFREGERQIVTPRIDRWLLDHPEGIICRTDEHRDLLSRLTTDESNSQRAARIGSSSRGTCLRQQTFRYLGMPGLRKADSVLQNLFNDGTWRHIRWQMMGTLAGVFTGVEVKYTLPAYNLGTSVDGENTDEDFLFELKGMRYYGKVIENGIPEGHNLQIHTAMLAAERDRTVYVVEDKGCNDWKEIVIRRDEKIIRQVQGELNAITDAIEDQKLPPVRSACKAHQGTEYNQCPYKTECLGQKGWPENSTWGTSVQVGRRNGQPGGLANGTRRNAGRAVRQAAAARRQGNTDAV